MNFINTLNKRNAFLLGFYVASVLFWIAIQLKVLTGTPTNYMFSFALNSIAFLGGVMGIYISRKWGGFSSAVGKGLMFLSLGLISWGGLGGYVWSYYNFILHQSAPYPSLADVGFVLAIPLWVLGVFYLSKATGARFSLEKSGWRIAAILIPLIIAVVSYYVLFVVARDSQFDFESGWLKIALDFFYPLGDWIILTMAILVWGLSLQYLGGRFKWPVLITLFGFIVMYLADFSFSYTTTVGTYYNGNFSDFLFITALFIMGYGINSIDGNST